MWHQCSLRSLLMGDDGQFLDMTGLTVPLAGGLRETGNPWMPFELVDTCGGVVAPVTAYLKDVQACGRSEATLRSYGMDLLRWFRYCWAAELGWDQATRAEAGDFCRWLLAAGKPGTGGGYALATAAHCETVLRHFYDFHLEAGRLLVLAGDRLSDAFSPRRVGGGDRLRDAGQSGRLLVLAGDRVSYAYNIHQ